MGLKRKLHGFLTVDAGRGISSEIERFRNRRNIDLDCGMAKGSVEMLRNRVLETLFGSR
mgnify:CR=1 FL=1